VTISNVKMTIDVELYEGPVGSLAREGDVAHLFNW
jgi:hypothetical protein